LLGRLSLYSIRIRSSLYLGVVSSCRDAGANLVFQVVGNHAMRSKYPDPSSGLHACLEPHSVNIAIKKRDMHLLDPPGGWLGRLALEPMNIISFGIYPELSAQENFLFAFREQF
jgi:hypothetical protein